MIDDRKRLCLYGDRRAEKGKSLTRGGVRDFHFYDSFFACSGGVWSAVHRMVLMFV